MENAAIELSGERKISFRDRTQNFIYTFRRLEAKDWLKYFNSVTVENEREGKDTVQRIDIRSAGIALVDETLNSVEGYRVSGDMPADWKQKIHHGHKIKAADLLTDVGESSAMQSMPFSISDFEEIGLTAFWGVAENGSNVKFDGLVHRIASPNAEQRRVYMRSMSETRVAGSRSGRTIYRSSAPLLIRLYDELVQGVDGYTWQGQPLVNDVALIRANMDAYHKVAAMKQIFATPEDEMETAAAA